MGQSDSLIQQELLTNDLLMVDAVDLLKKDPWALCLARAKSSCHRLVITASYFRAYSHTTRISQRFKSVRAFLAILDLLQVSGNMDAQHALDNRHDAWSFGSRLGVAP